MNRYQIFLALLVILTASGENGGPITPGKESVRRNQGWREFFSSSRLLTTLPRERKDNRRRRKPNKRQVGHDGKESDSGVPGSRGVDGIVGNDSKQTPGVTEQSHTKPKNSVVGTMGDQRTGEFPRIDSKSQTANREAPRPSHPKRKDEAFTYRSPDRNSLPNLLAWLTSPVLQRLGIWALAGIVIREVVTTFMEEVSEALVSSPSSRNAFHSKQVTLVLHELVTKQRLHPDHVALATLAYKLHVAGGLPYLSSGRTETDGRRKSVQSILLSLTKTEVSFLEMALYDPNTSSSEGWQSIEGLDNVKDDLLDRLRSLQMQSSPSPYSSLMKSAGGILLYGPPGCGKSMLMKGLGQLAKTPILVVSPSVLMRKYVGETEQLVRTLFPLARKLSPCILCLDEVDGIFRERHDDEHDAMRECKTELLQQWDGIHTSGDNGAENEPILVFAASNRPFDIDPAVLRRLPQAFFVGLPMDGARLEIMLSLLKKIPCSDMDLKEIVRSTEGFAPSDIVQLIQTAVQIGPFRDGRKNSRPNGPFRPLRIDDLAEARRRVGPTPLSRDYCDKLSDFTRMSSPSYRQRHGPPSNGAAQTPQGVNGPYYAVDSIEIDSFFPDNAEVESTFDFESSSESEWTDESEDYSDDDL